MAGDPGNLWVSAERQTGGRGSRGRAWQSGEGNLLASLLLTFDRKQSDLHQLTFVASLAISDAVREIISSDLQIALKWPNDVLVEGKKVSGILLESYQFDQSRYVAIGIGVNLASHPTETPFPAISLAALGEKIAALHFLRHLSRHMQRRLVQWQTGANFAAIRRDWLQIAAGLNRKIVVNVPRPGGLSSTEGVFRGLDDDGLMRLETVDGSIEKISVADVFLID